VISGCSILIILIILNRMISWEILQESIDFSEKPGASCSSLKPIPWYRSVIIHPVDRSGLSDFNLSRGRRTRSGVGPGLGMRPQPEDGDDPDLATCVSLHIFREFPGSKIAKNLETLNPKDETPVCSQPGSHDVPRGWALNISFPPSGYTSWSWRAEIIWRQALQHGWR